MTIPPKLARRSRFRPELFIPLSVGRTKIGWLRPQLAARLGGWPEVFKAGADEVQLLNKDALAPVVEQLAQEGFIPGWRNERYRIAELFEIERAAARPFGLTTYAVHVNGVVANASMWVARRSANKMIDPGMLDNLVGGGLTAGLSPDEVLIKEAREEAGIAADVARSAMRAGTLRILREVPEGVQSELIYVYDLALPPDFEPKNQDGEVSEFKLTAFDRIPDWDEFTFEAALVALDYLSRRNVQPGSATAR